MDSINWLSRELKRPSDQARHQADGERPVSACFAILGDLRALAVNPFFRTEGTVAEVEHTRAKMAGALGRSARDVSGKTKPRQSVPVVPPRPDTFVTAKIAKAAKRQNRRTLFTAKIAKAAKQQEMDQKKPPITRISRIGEAPRGYRPANPS